MKPTRKSRRRKADASRQRIVEAARAHFFSHGFRSVTMDDLADELGISKKTLYAHFRSKIALLEAVLAAHPAVKILVQHEGWHRITQPDLVRAGAAATIRGAAAPIGDGRIRPAMPTVRCATRSGTAPCAPERPRSSFASFFWPRRRSCTR